MLDDQVKEPAHSDEVRKPVKVDPKRERARDGRGNAIDEPTEGHDEPHRGESDADTRGAPGIKKSSS